MYLGNGVGPQGTTETERRDEKSSYMSGHNHKDAFLLLGMKRFTTDVAATPEQDTAPTVLICSAKQDWCRCNNEGTMTQNPDRHCQPALCTVLSLTAC